MKGLWSDAAGRPALLSDRVRVSALPAPEVMPGDFIALRKKGPFVRVLLVVEMYSRVELITEGPPLKLSDTDTVYRMFPVKH